MEHLLFRALYLFLLMARDTARTLDSYLGTVVNSFGNMNDQCVSETEASDKQGSIASPEPPATNPPAHCPLCLQYYRSIFTVLAASLRSIYTFTVGPRDG